MQYRSSIVSLVTLFSLSSPAVNPFEEAIKKRDIDEVKWVLHQGFRLNDIYDNRGTARDLAEALPSDDITRAFVHQLEQLGAVSAPLSLWQPLSGDDDSSSTESSSDDETRRRRWTISSDSAESDSRGCILF